MMRKSFHPRLLIVAIALALAGCAKPRSGRDWTFDRDTRRLADVQLRLRAEYPTGKQIEVDADHQCLVLKYQVEVLKVWETVYFYSISDWYEDGLGRRTDARVGEISDPGGFSKPPRGMVDSPSQIPTEVRRALPPSSSDRMSLSRYPLRMDWRIVETDNANDGLGTTLVRATDDGREVIRVRAQDESKRDEIRLTRNILETLIRTGNIRFALILELTPDGEWKDPEAMEMIRAEGGKKEYKVTFTREDVFAALGK